ncbi:hypothetical protein EDB83DRAFT_2331192 [Lactarius deliciosus]|nr:hypothetical protein EDB83DRAFT_2331192 [Lactarius deliciosus]
MTSQPRGTKSFRGRVSQRSPNLRPNNKRKVATSNPIVVITYKRAVTVFLAFPHIAFAKAWVWEPTKVEPVWLALLILCFMAARMEMRIIANNPATAAPSSSRLLRALNTNHSWCPAQCRVDPLSRAI